METLTETFREKIVKRILCPLLKMRSHIMQIFSSNPNIIRNQENGQEVQLTNIFS